MRALALGAKMVMIGRPWVWALGARGGAGVAHVLSILEKEIRTTMQLIGARSVVPFNGAGDFLCTKPEHWLYEGTGLKRGDEFGGKDTIVGYECDGCEFEMKEGLPVPTHNEHDGGPYIAAGIMVVRNPKTGKEVPITPRRVGSDRIRRRKMVAASLR